MLSAPHGDLSFGCPGRHGHWLFIYIDENCIDPVWLIIQLSEMYKHSGIYSSYVEDRKANYGKLHDRIKRM